jgi:hypothetical protein
MGVTSPFVSAVRWIIVFTFLLAFGMTAHAGPAPIRPGPPERPRVWTTYRTVESLEVWSVKQGLAYDVFEVPPGVAGKGMYL